MKLLSWTAVAALAIGIITLIATGATWPEWNSTTEYLKAATAAQYAGAEAPSALSYVTPPADFAMGHMIALYLGGASVSVGILAGLLAMHARAIREGREAVSA